MAIEKVQSLTIDNVLYVNILVSCIQCRETSTVMLPKAHWDAREDFTRNIQDIMPTITDTERELLVKSGYCGKCWDAMFQEPTTEEAQF